MSAANGCSHTLHQRWPTVDASPKQLGDFPGFALGLDVRMATKKSTQGRNKLKTERATAAKAAAKPDKAKAKAKAENSKRVRPIEPMPAFVRTALRKRDLLAHYRARPDYQRNDYLRWIAQAKREATQHKRLEQMLDELDRGDVYMNMAWRSG